MHSSYFRASGKEAMDRLLEVKSCILGMYVDLSSTVTKFALSSLVIIILVVDIFLERVQIGRENWVWHFGRICKCGELWICQKALWSRCLGKFLK